MVSPEQHRNTTTGAKAYRSASLNAALEGPLFHVRAIVGCWLDDPVERPALIIRQRASLTNCRDRPHQRGRADASAPRKASFRRRASAPVVVTLLGTSLLLQIASLRQLLQEIRLQMPRHRREEIKPIVASCHSTSK